MKITKSVLSILAIAISSSAFASTPTESNYAKITADAYARATHSLQGESVGTDSKNESTLILIKSNSNTAYAYKVYSEQESKTVKDLSDKLSKIGLSDDVIYETIKAQLTEDRKDSAYVAQLNNVREIDSSLRAQYAESAKNIIENNLSSDLNETKKQIYSTSQLFAYSKALHDRKGWASVISHLYGQEINKNITSKEFADVVASLQEYERAKEVLDFNSLPADAPTPKVVLDKNLFALTMFDVNHLPTDDSKLAEKIAVLDPKDNVSIRDGAEQVAADFKAQENAKAISELNNLQELALKESDPTLKNRIKQAADLKLAGYAK